MNGCINDDDVCHHLAQSAAAAAAEHQLYADIHSSCPLTSPCSDDVKSSQARNNGKHAVSIGHSYDVLL